MYWVLLIACLAGAALVAYKIEKEEEKFNRARQEREQDG